MKNKWICPVDLCADKYCASIEEAMGSADFDLFSEWLSSSLSGRHIPMHGFAVLSMEGNEIVLTDGQEQPSKIGVPPVELTSPLLVQSNGGVLYVCGMP